VFCGFDEVIDFQSFRPLIPCYDNRMQAPIGMSVFARISGSGVTVVAQREEDDTGGRIDDDARC
jgi:hypothetical protein